MSATISSPRSSPDGSSTSRLDSSGSIHDQQQTKKRTRASKPKVRTGCITWIRRVKCGEEKPACVRCTSTGRTCDGYDRERWPSRPRPVVDPLEGAELAKSEFLAACEHNEALRFMRPLAPDLNGAKISRRFFSQARPILTISGSEYLCAFSAFWGQVCQLDLEALHPAVHHAMVALSATYQLVRFPDIPFPDDFTPDSLDVFAIQHYNQSIAHLANPVDPHCPDSIRVTLACCLLFIFTEAFRQNHSASVTHLINGLRIISSLPTSHLAQPPSPPPLSMPSLVHLFSRLEFAACFLPNSLPPTLIPRLSSITNTPLPAQFTTPSILHHHLTHFHYSVLAHINDPSPPPNFKLLALSSHLVSLTTTFLSNNPSLIPAPFTPSGHRLHLDLLHFRCAQLLLHTHLDKNYASYEPLHLAILRLATILHPSPYSLGLGHRPLSPRQKEIRGGGSRLCPLVLGEVHLAAPLWLVARQTGYAPSLREEAVRLMAETLVPVGEEKRIPAVVEVLERVLGEGEKEREEGPRGLVAIGCVGRVWDALEAMDR